MFKIISITVLSSIAWGLLVFLAYMANEENGRDTPAWLLVLLGGPLYWLIWGLVCVLNIPRLITDRLRQKV